MENDLKSILETRFGKSPAGANKRYFDYALSNRERGRSLYYTIKHFTDFTFSGSRVLDIGCAYGGFLIRAAELGASAWGVEISDRFFEMGKANIFGEPGDIQILHGDILSHNIITQLPNDFDLILVNDVFEHIFDTARLLRRILEVSNEKAIMAFAVPNPFSLDNLLEECHAYKPAASLWDMDHWRDIRGAVTVYYRPWHYYSAMLKSFGFGSVTPWNQKPDIQKCRSEALLRLDEVEEAVRAAQYSKSMEAIVLMRLSDLRAELERDVQVLNDDDFWWKYTVPAWHGHAVRNASVADETIVFS